MTITKNVKKGSLRDLLLQENIGEMDDSPKPLAKYLTKPIGKKVVSKSDKNQTEDEVVVECKRWLKANGWECKTIYTGGIPTGNGKYAANPAKGIPDCIAFHPKTKRMIWIEFKKSKGGVVSFEQESWHILLKNSNQEVYVINSKELLEEVLTSETEKFRQGTIKAVIKHVKKVMEEE